MSGTNNLKASYGVAVSSGFIVATGGIITYDGNYKIHTFTTSGTFQVTSGSGNVWDLIVAGGGGGGLGGGGAGGLIDLGGYSVGVTVGSYSVTVGAGGAGVISNSGGSVTTSQTQGGNSSFNGYTAIGGGSGGFAPLANNNSAGGSGGSGGGGGTDVGGGNQGAAGGSTSGQGHNGGTGAYSANSAYGKGGGGGAGAVGTSVTSHNGGAGGVGQTSTISGGATYYAGGGGGGSENGSGYTGGAGGLGGGGAGASYGTNTGTSGTANTGGGGGGTYSYNSATGGAGGSGVVIIRYQYTSISFATWNPSDKGSSCTLSNGNLTASNAVSLQNSVRATLGKSAGKWYWEVTVGGSGAVNECPAGIANSSMPVSTNFASDANGYGYATFVGGGYLWHSGGGTSFGSAFVGGDVIGCALDMDNGTFKVYKNGTLQGTIATGLTGTWYPAGGSIGSNASNYTANFGASAFSYAVPSGYNAGVYVTNFATWDPANAYGVTLSGNNLTATCTGYSDVISTKTVAMGAKAYWEVTVTAVTGAGGYIGVANSFTTTYPGDYNYSIGYNPGGVVRQNNGASVGSLASYTTGDIIGIALDLSAYQVTFYKNGVLQGTFSIQSGYAYYAAFGGNGGTTITNFGASAFSYAVPVGFNAGIS